MWGPALRRRTRPAPSHDAPSGSRTYPVAADTDARTLDSIGRAPRRPREKDPRQRSSSWLVFLYPGGGFAWAGPASVAPPRLSRPDATRPAAVMRRPVWSDIHDTAANHGWRRHADRPSDLERSNGSAMGRRKLPDGSSRSTRRRCTSAPRRQARRQFDVQQRAALAWVQSNLRPSLMVDSYVFVETSDPRGDWLRSYWIRQFGFSRQNQPKGIAVVTL